MSDSGICLYRFYVPKFGWTLAIKLRAGDILVLSNGEYVVVEAIQHELLESPIKVYNFEVEDFHTYFVGESSVLVHNMCTELDNNKSKSGNLTGSLVWTAFPSFGSYGNSFSFINEGGKLHVYFTVLYR